MLSDYHMRHPGLLPELHVEPMQMEHVGDVSSLAGSFFHESDAVDKLILRLDRFMKIVEGYAHDLDKGGFVIYVPNGDLIGYILMAYQHQYTQALVGEVYQFYVRKYYRGSRAGRLLVGAADRWFHEHGCNRVYAQVSHGGTDQSMTSNLYINLWRKFGYAPMGTVVMKEIA